MNDDKFMEDLTELTIRLEEDPEVTKEMQVKETLEFLEKFDLLKK